MASKKSYTITIKNNRTEKEGLNYLLRTDSRFIFLDKKNRKVVMKALNIDKKFLHAFDLIYIENYDGQKDISLAETKTITLIELKTTQKELSNNPHGFFFGATENEFNLAKQFGNRYKFCFVSLHRNSRSHALLTLDELDALIKNKRIQYQINLKN